MANITNKKFINSLSHKLDKTPKVIMSYLDAITDEILRETSRGNTVTIDNLGKFQTALIGGYSGYSGFAGGYKYIKPKVVLKMKSTKQVAEILNDSVMATEMSNLIEQEDFDNESNYTITTKTEYDKDDMYLIFEQIKEHIANSNNIFLSEIEEDNEDEE